MWPFLSRDDARGARSHEFVKGGSTIGIGLRHTRARPPRVSQSLVLPGLVSLSSALADDREMHAGEAEGGGRGGGERGGSGRGWRASQGEIPAGTIDDGENNGAFSAHPPHPEGENVAVLTRDCPCSYKKTRPVSSRLRVQLQLVAPLKYLVFFLSLSPARRNAPLEMPLPPATACKPQALRTDSNALEELRTSLTQPIVLDALRVLSDFSEPLPRRFRQLLCVHGDDTADISSSRRRRQSCARHRDVIRFLVAKRVARRRRSRVITRNFQQKLRGSWVIIGR